MIVCAAPSKFYLTALATGTFIVVLERQNTLVTLASPNMNVGEAADYLRVSAKTLQRETNNRQIRVARIGRRLVYRKVDLDRYLELKVLAN